MERIQDIQLPEVPRGSEFANISGHYSTVLSHFPQRCWHRPAQCDACSERCCAGAGQCSNATLKGAYGAIISGVRSIGGVRENFVAVARRSFDGNGNFVTDSSSAHGVSSGTQTSTAPPPGKYSGTYQVNADCTGTAVLFSPVPDKMPNIKSNFVIVDNGKELREIVMSPSDGVVTADFRHL